MNRSALFCYICEFSLQTFRAHCKVCICHESMDSIIRDERKHKTLKCAHSKQNKSVKNPPLNRSFKYKPPGGLYLENTK